MLLTPAMQPSVSFSDPSLLDYFLNFSEFFRHLHNIMMADSSPFSLNAAIANLLALVVQYKNKQPWHSY
jgi:hypothetical protein